jgi:hypothetical protein
MKQLLTILICASCISAYSQNEKNVIDSTTEGILLNQLKQTHDKPEWFVPIHGAIENLTPAQALWRPDDSSHSIVQLVSHLIFWNLQGLQIFKGIHTSGFSGNNDETFATLPPDRWNAIVTRMDSVCKAWEQAIALMGKNISAKNLMMISQMSIHNAYHTGQIMYIRKQEHAWDSSKGVK